MLLRDKYEDKFDINITDNVIVKNNNIRDISYNQSQSSRGGRVRGRGGAEADTISNHSQAASYPFSVEFLGPSNSKTRHLMRPQKYQVVITGQAEDVSQAAEFIAADVAKYSVEKDEKQSINNLTAEQFDSLMNKKKEIACQTNVTINHIKGQIFYIGKKKSNIQEAKILFDEAVKESEGATIDAVK